VAQKKKVWWYSPKDGKLSFIGEFDSKITPFTYDGSYNRDNDQVLIAIDSSKNYISTEMAGTSYGKSIAFLRNTVKKSY
jgi:hypothetical protein